MFSKSFFVWDKLNVFQWDNGQGPWGKPPAPGAGVGKDKRRSEKRGGTAGADDAQPRDAGRRRGNLGGPGNGPGGQPDIEDVMNQLAERLRGFWRGGRGGNGGGFGGGFGDSGENVLKLAGVALVGIWLLSSFYIVGPDEAGVVTRFGQYVKTSTSGLNYHLPWPIDRVQKIAVTRENVIEVGFRSALSGDSQPGTSKIQLAGTDVPQESLMLTQDENIVDLDFTVRWKVANPEQFIFNVADPEGTVAAVAESVMRETIGRHPIDDALADNKIAIQQEARKHLQAVLDFYRIGVQVTGVELQQVNPPGEVIDAFRDVQAARADAEKAINVAQGYANQILPQARGQAAQVVQNAEGYKLATIAEAEGDAARFNAQVGAYKANPAVVRDRLYLQAMQEVLKDANKVVVTGRGGNNLVPFLPLNQLAPKAAGGEATEAGQAAPATTANGETR